jgi:hypothetical protein
MFGPDATGTSEGRQYLFYKIATGTESGTETVTFGGDLSNLKIARIYRFRGTRTVDFYEDTDALTADEDDIVDAPSVQSTVDNSLALAFVFITDDYAIGSFTGESGGDWTECVAEYMTTAGADGCI